MGRMKTTGVSHNKKSKMFKPIERNMTLKSNTQSQCSPQSIKTFLQTSSALKEGCSSASHTIYNSDIVFCFLTN